MKKILQVEIEIRYVKTDNIALELFTNVSVLGSLKSSAYGSKDENWYWGGVLIPNTSFMVQIKWKVSCDKIMSPFG